VEQEALKKPLAFVNRYAEALDVLVPNLANHECLREGLDVKYDTPLAAQPPGTGKTLLGRNITAILCRPREADAAAEAAMLALAALLQPFSLQGFRVHAVGRRDASAPWHCFLESEYN
jgi:hypothetical protein